VSLEWTMRTRGWLAAMCCAAVLAGGCERNEPPRREASYRSSVPVPASVLTVESDRGVMADQAALARLSGPEPEASVSVEGPIEQVRDMVRDIRDAFAQGASDQAQIGESFGEYFVPDDAELVRQVIQAQAPVVEKQRALQEVLELEMGPDAAAEIWGKVPAMAGAAAGPAGTATDPQAMLAKAADFQPEDLELTESDGKVLLGLGDSGMQIAFVQIDGVWKIDLPTEFDGVLTAMPALMTAYGDFLDEMIAGVDEGAITVENLPEAMESAYQKHVMPAMQTFMAAVAGEMIKTAGTGEGASPAPSPASAAPAAEEEQSPQESVGIEPVETQPVQIEPVEEEKPPEKTKKKPRGKIGLIMSPLDRAMEEKSQP